MIAQSTIEISMDGLLVAEPEDYVRLPEPRALQETLAQSCRWAGVSRQLTFFNDHFLEWQERRGRRLIADRVINLRFIHPQPVRHREVAWKTLFAGVAVLLAAVLAGHGGGVLVAAALAGMACLLLLRAYRRSYERLIFRTRHGGIAVFELFAHNPSKKTVSVWIAQISQRAQASFKALPGGRASLAAEIAEHRRMVEEGWLSRERYEQARKRVLAHFK